MAGKLGLSNLALTFAGRNIMKFTPYQGTDPESNNNARRTGTGINNNFFYGVDAFGTPIPRRLSFAVQFGF
jgi:hypothetical protein